MKWFMCLGGNMLEPYWDCLRVALATAPRNELEPHFVYDGPDDPKLDWLAAQGVVVHRHRVTFADKLIAYYGERSDPCCCWCLDKTTVALGVFLRCEIPLLCADQYAFYTDCDVMFTGQRLKLTRYLPELFCAAPEWDPNDQTQHFNAGVLLLNLPGLRKELPRLCDHLGGNYDQDALLGLAGSPSRRSRIDPLFNWKAYWGPNSLAKLIHFHGPKPGWTSAPTADEATLAPLRNAYWRDNEQRWLKVRDSL